MKELKLENSDKFVLRLPSELTEQLKKHVDGVNHRSRNQLVVCILSDWVSRRNATLKKGSKTCAKCAYWKSLAMAFTDEQDYRTLGLCMRDLQDIRIKDINSKRCEYFTFEV